jgi:hypothetical protein
MHPQQKWASMLSLIDYSEVLSLTESSTAWSVEFELSPTASTALLSPPDVALTI